MTADKLTSNKNYKILEISDCSIKSRLMDMGCIPNTTIVKLFEAPFGDPIAYSINGDYVLSLRVSEAINIIVDKTI